VTFNTGASASGATGRVPTGPEIVEAHAKAMVEPEPKASSRRNCRLVVEVLIHPTYLRAAMWLAMQLRMRSWIVSSPFYATVTIHADVLI
jgi:hypothetical protein